MSTPTVCPEPRHWLVKFAPYRTSWAEIVRRGTFTLRGVRSAAGRANLAAMRLCDRVLFYHSQQELSVMGVMEVTREAYPDPTSSDPQWLTCDFCPIESLSRPVPLAGIKGDPQLAAIALIRLPRGPPRGNADYAQGILPNSQHFHPILPLASSPRRCRHHPE